MARLTRLPGRIGGMARRVRPLPKKADDLYRSAEWRALVARIKAERGHWCSRCGESGRIVGDHIIEVKDGGTTLDADNVQLLCHACHQAKTAKVKAERAATRRRNTQGG